ncbi:Hpt domain-containing protein [Desertivirga xinjiangensis]|uniref:Hpt domain-containing protein n=1 Tax=Desertivirga xinjiangensis TaxID=539206 RepID=UPI0021090FB0|nr:Hpt domain-containing protein [Pedobacter xinjiangensis]
MAETNNRGFEIDLTYLNDVAGGSGEFIIDMIDIFIEQTPVYFDQLEQAIKANDWKGVGDMAHKIKPTLAFIGINEAKESMAEIERKARAMENVSEIPDMFSSLNQKCAGLYEDLNKIKEEIKAKL